MVHRSGTPRQSRRTILIASLAVVLVCASLGLALAVRGAGETEIPPSPAASSASPVSPLASWMLRVTRPASSTMTPATATLAAPQTPSATALTIQGVPPAAVNYGLPYSFVPTVSGQSDALTFSIQNKPAWAAFNSSNGALTGTPEAADVGSDANIVISVSDGTSSMSLPAFNISVNEVSEGAVTLDWSGVTQTLADTTLTGLAGYIVYYGTSADNLNQQIRLANPGLTSYMVTNLASGTWYFGIAAYTQSGVEGAVSSVVQKTIP